MQGKHENRIFDLMNYRLLALLLFPITCFAQVIPLQRRADWTRAGVVQPFTGQSIVINPASFGAVGDGINDDAPAVIAAINSLNGAAGTIQFAPGTYLLRSALTLPDSITLSGSSPASIKLLFDLGGNGVNCISITKSQSTSFVPVISGFTRGSDSLILSSVAGLSVGDMIELREQNGAWDVQPATWAAYSVGQILKIDSIAGNTVYLEEALRIDYDPQLSPELRKIIPVTDVTITCLGIERLDAASFGYNIGFEYAYNCRVSGIESKKSVGAHIAAEASSHLSIEGSYFHHAFAYDGTSTHGYGVMLATHTSDCLIENNVFEHLRHSMMAKQGANGNVFAYNYSFDPFRTEVPNNAGGDISLHGHYAYANLFEGNMVQTLHIDQTWGPSGPYNTFFRNRAALYGIIMSTGGGDTMNFVGNEITHPSSGYYILNGTGHLEYGNNVQGTIQPTGTGNLNDVSYFRTSPPAYWTSQPWPSIGAPSSPGSGSIPAFERFVIGMPTSCSPSTIGMMEQQENVVSLFPIPAKNELMINAPAGSLTLTIRDITGRIMLSQDHENNSGTITINRPAGLPAGVYLLQVSQENKQYQQRIVFTDQL
jgi:hypothetical protein